MLIVGEVISYWEMCQAEGASLQRGMNYRLRGRSTVILMSLRKNAPYADRVEENGKVLIYEGHDVPRKINASPKLVDQEMYDDVKKLTQNGLFFHAAKEFKEGNRTPEMIKVYEKIRDGIWSYDGVFKLTDAWTEESKGRKVFKFRLEITDQGERMETQTHVDHNRLIPKEVKIEVWKRDKGRCVNCGSAENLHFDHIIPFSKGGSSLNSKNIQILCSKCNLAKHDKIE